MHHLNIQKTFTNELVNGENVEDSVHHMNGGQSKVEEF